MMSHNVSDNDGSKKASSEDKSTKIQPGQPTQTKDQRSTCYLDIMKKSAQ